MQEQECTLDLNTIEAAVAGEKWALEKVLAYYADYIEELATVEVEQPDGSVKKVEAAGRDTKLSVGGSKEDGGGGMKRQIGIFVGGVAMKIEIGKDFPQYFKPAYPEEFELFSHFEVTAGIPTVLFAITTWKENGKPNVCFHSWSCFHGDKTAFFAVMGNLYQHTHTYANIQREKCFCINFLPISYYDKLVDTINHNDIETDEFAVGSFTLSNAKTIHAPAIQEAFINMECTLKEAQDLSGAGITAMIVGQVQHISVEKEYAQGYEQRYGKKGFMMLIPAPQDLVTGEPNQSAIATINIEKYD